MGLSLSKKNYKIRVVDILLKGEEFPHLVLRGEIIIKRDNDFDIPEIYINIDGYFPALARLWPQNRSSLPSTPNVTPNVSKDSGTDITP